MPAFPHTLIGLGPFADLGCKIVFTKTSVTVFHPDGHPLLSGWRDETGPRLWHFPLTAEAAQTALANAALPPHSPPIAEAAHVAVDTTSHPPQLATPPLPLRAPSADVRRTSRKQKWRRRWSEKHGSASTRKQTCVSISTSALKPVSGSTCALKPVSASALNRLSVATSALKLVSRSTCALKQVSISTSALKCVSDSTSALKWSSQAAGRQR